MASLLAPAAPAREPVRARHAMVVAQEPLAAGVGAAVLKSGGNAVDAAVAVAFALAVTHPAAGNIGGGGFLLARFSGGDATFLDFREAAPASAGRDMYLDAAGALTEAGLVGWRASGVPGTVRGLEEAHKKYGRKPWAELLAPAIRLARDGFPLSYAAASSLKSSAKLLARFPESKRIFLNNGKFFEPGDRLAQPELAATLERIAAHGAAEFYEGQTARRLAAEMAKNGGTITLADLKNYHAVERTPLTGHYKGYQILTSPPPSSGGIGILEMMGMLEGSGYEKAGAGAASTVHFMTEVMRRSYADRARYLGDPDFVRIPVTGLLDPRRLERLRAGIDPKHATPSSEIRGGAVPFESSETTHFNIVDSQGNAVALTYTINGGYGSGVTVPGLGFLLNNEMDDFSSKPGTPNLYGLIQGEANVIAPGKRPLSSMTPTIVLKDGKPYLVVGAPGGSRIINGVLEVILNVIDFGMTVQEAVDQPRFHHQWEPDVLFVEKGFSPDTLSILESMGHKIRSIPTVASVEAILMEDGWLEGANNGRSNSRAVGY